jgi:hypothetical protein
MQPAIAASAPKPIIDPLPEPLQIIMAANPKHPSRGEPHAEMHHTRHEHDWRHWPKVSVTVGPHSGLSGKHEHAGGSLVSLASRLRGSHGMQHMGDGVE